MERSEGLDRIVIMEDYIKRETAVKVVNEAVDRKAALFALKTIPGRLWEEGVELKLCPFCGSTARVFYVKPFEHNGRKGIDRWQVLCDGCGVATCAELSPEKAVERWNRRRNG